MFQAEFLLVYENWSVVILEQRSFSNNLWQMYDAGDFKFLTTVSSPPSQSWMGGNFVAADCILLWSRVSDQS